jgi:hypothetical protein
MHLVNQPSTAVQAPLAKPVSAASFTPGPWEDYAAGPRMQHDYMQPFAIAQTGQLNLVAGTFGDVQGGEEVAKANARLIAAAPDLLAAIQLLHDNLAEYQRINNIGGYENHDMKMARAAIKKARGQ